MKLTICSMNLRCCPVAPARERGLKSCRLRPLIGQAEVAPARERGLKSRQRVFFSTHPARRSRKGAWIEIFVILHIRKGQLYVAPARERGLKLHIGVSRQRITIVAPARERGLK